MDFYNNYIKYISEVFTYICLTYLRLKNYNNIDKISSISYLIDPLL